MCILFCLSIYVLRCPANTWYLISCKLNFYLLKISPSQSNLHVKLLLTSHLTAFLCNMSPVITETWEYFHGLMYLCLFSKVKVEDHYNNPCLFIFRVCKTSRIISKFIFLIMFYSSLHHSLPFKSIYHLHFLNPILFNLIFVYSDIAILF